jgi:hypothetical protein
MTPDGAPVTNTGTITVKVAVTVVVALSDRTHGAVPEHPPPDHPANRNPGPGVAVKVIDVACPNKAVQDVEQPLIPIGLLETEPVPDTLTVRL